ncbi:hypothetical protein AK812_SmicGene39371 [Symbiodinium microadriaticum]|uniref:Uncharacterized protein n=1 Tax=Symbiodinium microadriaticum TaxID=2951 RepID=A0A1Q9CBC7_SYMMI|nr:hypothetical protein AK812_SmicGene39371 [Symbiodinium microadriaticum]
MNVSQAAGCVLKAQMKRQAGEVETAKFQDSLDAMPRLSFEALTTPAPKNLNDRMSSVLSSRDAEKSEAGFDQQESPPGQASYSLKSYAELFPGYPPPATEPGKAGFLEDAPPELLRAERMYDGESSVLCGGSVNDNHITCGVHIFDDPKSGAPYVVPMPDTDRLLNAAAPMDEEVGGADDDAQGAPDPYMQAFGGAFLALCPPPWKATERPFGAPDPYMQAFGGAFLALCPPPWKATERYRKASFLDVGQSARIREAVSLRGAEHFDLGRQSMAQAMGYPSELSGLVVRNTFLEFPEFPSQNRFLEPENDLPVPRTRAVSDMTDTKLPWKVPIAMDSNAGVFQITRCQSAQRASYMRAWH